MKKIFKTLKYKNKIINLLLILLIIILWLLSRKISVLPYFFWDILRWMMIFFIVSMFTQKIWNIIIISLIICFWIEFSQLLQNQWMIYIRNTPIWWMLLWKWFLLSDLMAYSFWIYVSYFISRFRYINST